MEGVQRTFSHRLDTGLPGSPETGAHGTGSSRLFHKLEDVEVKLDEPLPLDSRIAHGELQNGLQ